MSVNISDNELLETMMEANSNVGSETVREDEPAKDEVKSEEVVQEELPKNSASEFIGQKIQHNPGKSPFADKEGDKRLVEEKKLSRIGEKIGDNMDVRDGWIDVPRSLLGDRSIFYPADWRFRIRPATVETIRNWSTIDEENFLSMDDVFTEVIKGCLSISTESGMIPCTNICSWDRFFFLLLIREYTFAKGEMKAEFTEDCIECGNPITFTLSSQTLMFELPDPDLLKMYDQETRTWNIVPEDYDVDAAPISLYVPTLEKESNIKTWLIQRQQENRNRKIDQVFLKFAAWLSPKISKDNTIANKQIREIERIYKSWDIDMFSFMDEVVKNIQVVPETKLTMNCPICGEEVTTPIRFPGKVSDLFSVQNKRKKFGTK